MSGTEADAAATLQALLPGMAVRVRSGRARLASLRVSRLERRLVLAVHRDLLADSAGIGAVAAWARRRGRGGPGEELDAAMHRVHLRRCLPGLPAWADEPTLGPTVDLAARLARIHRDGFADLPLPTVSWGRSPPHRRLSHLRFGCYRRREARIKISPRLDRPWIAACFLDHVLHHELCHHRQACQMLRGEAMHSPRFRQWERAFPGHLRALAWERAFLPWLLADATPPSATPGRSVDGGASDPSMLAAAGPA